MSARTNADHMVFGVRSTTFMCGPQSAARILGALLARSENPNGSAF